MKSYKLASPPQHWEKKYNSAWDMSLFHFKSQILNETGVTLTENVSQSNLHNV